MRYFKTIKDGYLLAVGAGNGGTEISEAEYANIMTVLNNMPVPPEGYGYKLTATLSWDLYPRKADTPDPAETVQEQAEAYKILMGLEG